MKEEIILKALELVIMILSAVFCRYAIPWMKQKLENDKVREAAQWVMYAVRWAEQVYESRTGIERKEAVLSFMKTVLNELGVELSEKQLDTLIEAAVNAMNDAKRTEIAATLEVPKEGAE